LYARKIAEAVMNHLEKISNEKKLRFVFSYTKSYSKNGPLVFHFKVFELYVLDKIHGNFWNIGSGKYACRRSFLFDTVKYWIHKLYLNNGLKKVYFNFPKTSVKIHYIYRKRNIWKAPKLMLHATRALTWGI